jgi:hypothetical protein
MTPSRLSWLDSRRKKLAVLLGAGLVGLIVVGCIGWKMLATSGVLVEAVERAITGATGFPVEIQSLSPGLDRWKLRGLRATSHEHGVELRADVVRLDLGLRGLSLRTDWAFAVHLEGVEVSRLDGGPDSTLRARRVTAVRRAGGALYGEGAGRFAQGGVVRWSVSTPGGIERVRGRLILEDLPLAALLGSLPGSLPEIETGGATVDADLAFRPGDQDGSVAISGTMSVEDLFLESARLAERPIEVAEVTFDGDLEASWSRARIAVASSTLVLNGLATRIEGTVARGDGGLEIDLDLELPETPCEEVFRAIPAGLLGPYAGFRLAGAVGGALSLGLDAAAPEATELAISVDDGCVFLEVPARARLDRFAGPFLHRAKDAEGDDFELATGPGTPAWTELEQINQFVVQAVIAHEDATFPGHAGFAVFAIEDALQANLRAGRFVRGGSTISMQLAKNLFLERDRTLARKVREVLLTWWLERQLDKRSILELYLNVVEYGPEIYGIRNAAEHYFQRKPADLRPAQAVFLATLLPNPVGRYEQFEDGALSARTVQEIRFLLQHMADRGRIGKDVLDYGLWELERISFFRVSWAEHLFGPRRPDAGPGTLAGASPSVYPR